MMDRYAQVLGLVILSLTVSSCRAHNALTNKVFPRIDRPTWSAVETAPDHFMVLAKDTKAEQEAVRELCQQHKFVCVGPEAGGRLVIIERRRK